MLHPTIHPCGALFSRWYIGFKSPSHLWLTFTILLIHFWFTHSTLYTCLQKVNNQAMYTEWITNSIPFNRFYPPFLHHCNIHHVSNTLYLTLFISSLHFVLMFSSSHCNYYWLLCISSTLYRFYTVAFLLNVSIFISGQFSLIWKPSTM